MVLEPLLGVMSHPCGRRAGHQPARGDRARGIFAKSFGISCRATQAQIIEPCRAIRQATRSRGMLKGSHNFRVVVGIALIRGAPKPSDRVLCTEMGCKKTTSRERTRSLDKAGHIGLAHADQTGGLAVISNSSPGSENQLSHALGQQKSGQGLWLLAGSGEALRVGVALRQS